MKIQIIRRILLTCLLAFAALVNGQQNTSVQELMRQYDKDNSQSLSSEEFQALYRNQISQTSLEMQARQTFQQADNNRNNELAMSELRQTLPLSGVQAAQRGNSSQSQDLSQLARQQPGELEGKAVQNRMGENIGDIEQVARQKSTGDIHVVVATGGFAGFGEKKAAVPVSELRLEGEQIVYTAQNPQQKLRQMTYNASDYEPVQEAGTQQQQANTSSLQMNQKKQQSFELDDKQLSQIAKSQPDMLMGKQVKNGQSGSVIGEVEMVVLDKQNTDFHVVISSDQFLEMGGNDLVISLQDLQAQGNTLILNSEKAVTAFAKQDYLLVEELN